MEFYRYADIVHPGTSNDIRAELRKYVLLRETPKGYWIIPSFMVHYPKEYEESKHWISKTSKRKFAYSTKEEAAFNFLKRKQNQVKILSDRLERAKRALYQAERVIEDEK